MEFKLWRCHGVPLPVALFFFFLLSSLAMPPIGTCSPNAPSRADLVHRTTPDQASADAAIRHARELSSREEFDAALEALSPFTHAPGDYPTIYSDYLVTLVWADRAEEALRLFEKLPQAVPRRPYLLMHMAGAYRRAGDLPHARKLYRESLQADPDNLDALEGLVTVLIESDDLDGAVQVLADTGKWGGNLFAVHLLKAKVLLYKGAYLESLTLYDALIRTRPKQQIAIAKTRDDLIASLPAEDQNRMIETMKSRVKPDGGLSKANYALALALCRRYEAAVAFMDSAALDPTDLPSDRLYRMAWAYLRMGRPADADRWFSLIISRREDHLPAHIGRIYCLADQGHAESAQSALDRLLAARPDDPELNFTQAYVFERQGRFWEAVQVYDHMLVVLPGNAQAQRLRLRALSDLGATSVAQQTASRLFPDDTTLHDSLDQDSSVDHIYWQEPRQAVKRLAALIAADNGQRYLFDYINALVRAGQYTEAIQAYQTAAVSGTPIPLWVKQSAADAYTAQRQPEQALQLYEELLAAAPDNDTYLLGKFYALQSLRRWREADELLALMKAKTPRTIVKEGKEQPNPAVYELGLVEAWYLAYQDRLAEAQDCFSRLHEQAPANMAARNGLAHVYLWRGWPRRALEAFEIMHGMDADYTDAWPGQTSALNQLNRKERARELADSASVDPRMDRQIQEVRRILDVDQMKQWRTEAVFEREEDDSRDLRILTELSVPWNLKTRWFGDLLWQHTEYGENLQRQDEPEDIQRIGIGLLHAPNDRWQFRTALSASMEDGKDLGAALSVAYTPDDIWSFGVRGDTFSTELAGRARAAGIDASLVGVDALWRQSDERQAGAGLTQTFFSDDNSRQELLLGYQQHLWRRHDWRLRGYADFYTVRNSKGDETVYFNPKDAWELSVTAMIEQTLRQCYQRRFVHRFYATLGSYHQAGYDGAWVGRLRYEQLHDFSDRHALQVGASIGRKVYDGDGVSDIEVDLVYQYRF